MKGRVEARERRARPRMTLHLEGVLVALSLIFVLEAIATEPVRRVYVQWVSESSVQVPSRWRTRDALKITLLLQFAIT